jgi:hypothetical protein
MGCEVRASPGEEPDRGLGGLVFKRFGVRQPGVSIDCRVQVGCLCARLDASALLLPRP